MPMPLPAGRRWAPSSDPADFPERSPRSPRPTVRRKPFAGRGAVPSNVKPEDQALIDECLDGHPDAFGELVLRYQDRLYNTLVGVLGSPHDARDVAQDAFVHAFRKLSTFRGQSAFYSWLFRIAMNAAISRKRKTKRIKGSLDAARENAGFEVEDESREARPDHPLELDEQRGQVRRALDQLSEEYRTVLVLKEIDGMKYEQIAEVVGCPIGTVRSRIHRARSELREKLRLLLAD